MKSKVSLIVAVAALLGAAAVGGWALVAHADDPPRHGAAPPRSTATTTPSAGATGPSVPRKPDGVSAFKIPEGTVDPLTGKSYCASAKLLAIYSRQGYGLNKQLGVVDGERFATRLRVIAAAYGRLADQAPGAGEVGAAWRALAAATTAAEDQLRVAGLQVQSQTVIVKLAELSQVLRGELPRATATLKTACGFSPAVFGV